MAISVRSIKDDELRPWLDCLSTGFLDRPDLDKIMAEVRPHWDLERAWAAFDGDLIVGTVRTWATELTVPGNAQVKASAVAAVTVRPTHRRRGILRQMIQSEHAAARARGEMASLLYASEYPIYSRFGYGSAVQQATWIVDLSSTGFHEAAGGRSGTVELIPADEAALETLRTVHEAWRLRQPGEIWRRPVMWLADLGLWGAGWDEPWKGFVAVHRDGSGAVDGFLRYHVEPKWEHRQPRSTLVVDELHGLTSEAQVALWRFAADVDLVTTLKAERRHPAERLPWLLTNARAAGPSEAGDGMWVRLHDVAGMLEARRYERSGAVVIEAVSREDPRSSSSTEERVRVALDATPDGARATITDRSADLTVEASALGAAYLGGTRLRNAVLTGGWDEHRAGALDEADALLVTRDVPWCSTFF